MDEKQHFFHVVSQTSRKFSKKFNERVSPTGLYSAQWAVIFRLHQTGPCTQTELCQYLNVESPTMTRTLTRMESMGWITRKEGTDRREKLISLSETALAMIPMWQEEVDSFEEKALQDINDEELRRAFHVLQKVIRNLD
ncbi:MarR family transcriptional regulator [Bacillus sp. AFS018417]|uniref:MarR family winged helix-turn-helix transcriptional regulator n=1 Tax=unclassified Bacillus (in: firmicutes) TaxID=185979 RepID=UPI000BF88451|nr:MULTISPECIES: MarR family transcriptional regulator [unclassified Bacillus (in: firmicutes)]MCP1124208.1 MarR family transcriptional regulator [Bacillus sp. 3103sda1]PEZ02218.1 MarR family transcriptional regulator [Bacillus sp. AFS018417]